MPRSWYLNRALWYFFALALILAGCGLLRMKGARRTTWQPTRPGIRFRRIVVYTRPGCHLCDEALAVLREHSAYLSPIEGINSESDGRLIGRFGDCIPVVEIDGKVRFRGRVDNLLLRRLIEGGPLADAEKHEPNSAGVS